MMNEVLLYYLQGAQAQGWQARDLRRHRTMERKIKPLYYPVLEDASNGAKDEEQARYLLQMRSSHKSYDRTARSDRRYTHHYQVNARLPTPEIHVIAATTSLVATQPLGAVGGAFISRAHIVIQA